MDDCLVGELLSPHCRIDHPELDPCDGRVLGNVLEIDGADGRWPYGTFIDPETCP